MIPMTASPAGDAGRLGPCSLAYSAGAPNLSVLVGSYRLDDGTWLNFAAPVATFRPFWTTPFFLVIVGTTALVLVISVWAVRRATAPLSMFGEAAERLGRDVNAPPLQVPDRSRSERAALAFNRMQERLQKLHPRPHADAGGDFPRPADAADPAATARRIDRGRGGAERRRSPISTTCRR